MIATIREDLCIGCGVCAKFCPDVFRMEGALAKVRVATVPPDEGDLVQATADVCPVRAIQVSEENENRKCSHHAPV